VAILLACASDLVSEVLATLALNTIRRLGQF